MYSLQQNKPVIGKQVLKQNHFPMEKCWRFMDNTTSLLRKQVLLLKTQQTIEYKTYNI